MSDLHVEFGGVHLRDDVDCDVVVLAGDIDVLERSSPASWARQTFPTRRIVQVLGNHEFYGWSHGGMQACVDCARTEARSFGIDFLECDRVDIEGVRFLGCVLWTDYELNGSAPEAMAAAAARMVDHRRIMIEATDGSGGLERFRPVHAGYLHISSVAWLERELALPHDGPTVVVTHHAPHPAVDHRHFIGSALSPAFVSDLSVLIEKYQPAVWISGHTHMSHRVRVGKTGSTLLVSNQRGYSNHPEVADAPFDPNLVISVEAKGVSC